MKELLSRFKALFYKPNTIHLVYDLSDEEARKTAEIAFKAPEVRSYFNYLESGMLNEASRKLEDDEITNTYELLDFIGTALAEQKEHFNLPFENY